MRHAFTGTVRVPSAMTVCDIPSQNVLATLGHLQEDYSHCMLKFRSAVFWDVTQHSLVFGYRCCGTSYWSSIPRHDNISCIWWQEGEVTILMSISSVTIYSKTCLKRTPYIPETWTNGK